MQITVKLICIQCVFNKSGKRNFTGRQKYLSNKP